MEEPIYKDQFVASLFDRMSVSYEFMNSITSLGFYPFWRQLAINRIRIDKGDHVADLLSGPGECWKHLLPKIGPRGVLTALDFSPGMMHLASKKRNEYNDHNICLLQENVLASTIPDRSQDVVICCYGLKTFESSQMKELAAEILRILKPGGRYSLVEVAIPENEWLKSCYLFYLGKVIPFLSRLLAENPDTYNYLEVYSNKFDGFDVLERSLENHKGNPTLDTMFFGCAKMISGFKS